MTMIGFDIETRPCWDRELEQMCPEFDPKQVKLGRLKDPAKIEAKIEEARASHYDDFVRNAALCPRKGRLLCIGVFHEKDAKFECIHDTHEDRMLREWWQLFRKATDNNFLIVGHNIFEFDLPFLCQRSWAHDIMVPSDLYQVQGGFIRWAYHLFDTRKGFQMGRRDLESNFDYVGEVMNTGGKEEGHHGANFHKLWKEDRATAMRYLANDARKPVDWANKMGFGRRYIGD